MRYTPRQDLFMDMLRWASRLCFNNGCSRPIMQAVRKIQLTKAYICSIKGWICVRVSSHVVDVPKLYWSVEDGQMILAPWNKAKLFTSKQTDLDCPRVEWICWLWNKHDWSTCNKFSGWIYVHNPVLSPNYLGYEILWSTRTPGILLLRMHCCKTGPCKLPSDWPGWAEGAEC